MLLALSPGVQRHGFLVAQGLEGDASWVQLGISALRFTGAKHVLSLGGGGAKRGLASTACRGNATLLK